MGKISKEKVNYPIIFIVSIIPTRAIGFWGFSGLRAHVRTGNVIFKYYDHRKSISLRVCAVTDSEKIVNYSIWVFFVLVYLSGSTILVFTVPTFPLFLIFVFLVELILVANMILAIRKLNRIKWVQKNSHIIANINIDLLDIENSD
jgi:hypothetical protein